MLQSTPELPMPPDQRERLIQLRRWMMSVFVASLLLLMAIWFLWQTEDQLATQARRILIPAAVFGAMVSWVLMVQIAYILYNWMLALMLGVAGLFFQLVIVVGIIFLNYQVSDRLSADEQARRNAKEMSPYE